MTRDEEFVRKAFELAFSVVCEHLREMENDEQRLKALKPFIDDFPEDWNAAVRAEMERRRKR